MSELFCVGTLALRIAHQAAVLNGLLLLCLSAGCGTTRATDSARTASEQLLISDAIDRSVQAIDFRKISGRKVYLDTQYMGGVVDRSYLVSTLRQHLLASGCTLASRPDDAVYIVEARAGAVGTNRHEVLFGIPAINVPTFIPVPGVPSSIPEIPIVKKTDRRGVAKLAVFAYHRATGAPVWQSGTSVKESNEKAFWILGAGPLQSGTIHEGTAFAGVQLKNPLARGNGGKEDQIDVARLGEERVFEAEAESEIQLATATEDITEEEGDEKSQ